MPRPFLNSFNAGEVAPVLDARVDIDKYKNGCRILENAIPKIQGGAHGRAGMEYMGDAKNDDKVTRLIPFTFDVTTSFVLEFGDGYLRFWSNGQQVESGGNPYEISTVYGEADLFNIQFTQVNDVVYLVDGDHPPQKLTRLADDSWTIADVDWIWPAMQDENIATQNLGTQTVTELLRLKTEEWVQAVGVYNATMSFSGLTDLTATTKTAKLDRWVSGAWSNVVTRTWTTSPPSDYTYTCGTLGTTLPGGATCDTFRITYSGPVHGSGALIQLRTDYKTDWPVYHPDAVFPDPSITYDGIGWRYTRFVYLDATQPQASLAPYTIDTGWQWRVRAKSLATLPTNNSCKVQSWNGAAWVDVATIPLVANKWTSYIGTAPGSPTIHRLKWAGTTATNGYAMWTIPESGPPFNTLLQTIGDGSALDDPEHGIMLLERIEPSAGSDITLTLNGTTGSGITMTASDDLFNESHVGSYWQIGHRRDSEDAGSSYLEAKPTAATADQYYSVLGNGAMVTNGAQTTGFRVLGGWDVFTYGTWIGTLDLQVLQADGTSWETIRSWSSLGTTGDRNVIASGTADTEQVMRFKFVKTTGVAISNVRFLLEPTDSRVYGLAKVTAYTSATVVTVTVLKDVWKTSATRLWSEGSWSDYRGYPRAITTDNQRIVYGGTEHEPLTFWGSVIGDFENFRRSSLADASYAFRIASAKANGIVWMSHHGRFMIGTQGDEWLVEPGAGDNNGVITASSVKITMQTSFGSAYIQPVSANDTIMFVERGRKRLREFVFQFERNAFSAPDLNLLASHIFANTEIKQLAFQSVPDPVVWVVTEDNRLMSMTFERDQSVVGWSRHITDGDVESVCVIYGGDSDEVWLSTKRTINGATARYIERLDPAKWSKLDDEDVETMIYLDCATIVVQASSTAVSGLDHLEGKTVAVLADGLVQFSKMVASGAITLDTAAETIVVGLPFTVRIQPNKLELALPDGTSQGRRFKVCASMLRFWKTGGAQYADGASDTFYDVPFRDPDRAATEIEPPFTGDKRVFLASRHKQALDITIRNTTPLPFSLLAIAPIVEASGQ